MLPTAKGLAHDRTWMFADESGKFITQRRYHKMALIVPKLVPDMANPTVRGCLEAQYEQWL